MVREPVATVYFERTYTCVYNLNFSSIQCIIQSFWFVSVSQSIEIFEISATVSIRLTNFGVDFTLICHGERVTSVNSAGIRTSPRQAKWNLPSGQMDRGSRSTKFDPVVFRCVSNVVYEELRVWIPHPAGTVR